MSAFTNYAKQKVGDAILRNTSFTPPATVYLALFTTATTDSGVGTEVASSIGYTRQAATWAAIDGNQTYFNSALITFGTASSAWGTVTDWALMDASTGGNMWLHGPLMTPVVVPVGQIVTLAASSFPVRFR